MNQLYMSLIFVSMLIVYHIAMVKWYNNKLLADKDIKPISDMYVPTWTPDHYELS